MRRRFFVERFDGGRATMAGDSAHHLARVLRAEPGQLYELSDGREVWLGRIDGVRKQAVEFTLVERLPARLPRLHLTLQLSIIKFDRFEWCLEKATELGAAEIIPLVAQRSEKSLVAAAAKRAARWQKILVESAQQARRLRPPALQETIRAREAFAAESPAPSPACKEAQSVVTNEIRLLLSERPDVPRLRKVLEGGASDRCTLAVGPEGGWVDEEFAAAQAAGFVETSLGDNILRTETAVIAGLAAVNFALAD